MSSFSNGGEHRGSQPTSEDAVDARRYFEALRRSRWLMIAIVALLGGVVLAISLALPKSYQATASVVVQPDTGTLSTLDSEALQRQLATTVTLTTTNAVLAQAAKALPGETRESISGDISAAVDQNANIIVITANYKTAVGAAKLATAVANAFLAQQTAIERGAIMSSQAALNNQIVSLRAAPDTQGSVASQIAALQARADELTVALASAGSDYQLSQEPQPPTSAASPKPVRNTIIAIFAGIFIAVLVALARDQLQPRISGQRELGHLLGVPVLAGIPYVGRRRSARTARAEYETYQTLSASLRLALPPEGQHIILTTSATHGEGKTTVSAKVGRLLAQAGHQTLLVSGDLRWPKLDPLLGVEGQDGLRDLLLASQESGDVPAEVLERMILPVDDGQSLRGRGSLDVLPAGSRVASTPGLLSMTTLEPLFAGLRQLPHAYVIFDAPPILGVADTQLFAQFCDHLLLVARLNRVSTSRAIDMRELLDRIAVPPIGVVAIGARLTDSPYYWREDLVTV
jgi:Mrp family chromosome partitioning ATPase/capsular polysaccharide biosynthesis protein